MRLNKWEGQGAMGSQDVAMSSSFLPRTSVQTDKARYDLGGFLKNKELTARKPNASAMMGDNSEESRRSNAAYIFSDLTKVM